MPPLITPTDAVKVAAAIIAAVADGDLTPAEASELTRAVENFANTFKIADFDERLTKLEKHSNQKADAE